MFCYTYIRIRGVYMFSLVIILIFFSILILSLVFSYKGLSKINYQLNGLEILFLQLSFILIFFGSKYDSESYYEFLMVLGIFFIIFLAYYYLIRMIKTKCYIKWPMFIIYIILFVVNGYSLAYIPMSGWDGLGYALMFILFCGSTYIYLLLINFITFIIRKIKKITNTVYNLILKKEILISLILVFMFLPVFYGISYEKQIEYQLDEKKKYVSNEVLDYLNKKYGKGNFKVKTSECFLYDECELSIETSYFNDIFQIDINSDNYNIIYDEFIFKYYSNLYNKEINGYYELQELLEQQYREKNLNNSDYEIKIEGFYFDSDLYEDTYLGGLPTLANLEEFIEVRSKEVLVYKVFTKDDIEEFCEFIIKLYEDMNYSEDILWFKFNYDNPFSSSLHYKDDGYLRNAGEYWYYVYVDATPIHIKK